jgi:hypothetical protein
MNLYVFGVILGALAALFGAIWALQLFRKSRERILTTYQGRLIFDGGGPEEMAMPPRIPSPKRTGAPPSPGLKRPEQPPQNPALSDAEDVASELSVEAAAPQRASASPSLKKPDNPELEQRRAELRRRVEEINELVRQGKYDEVEKARELARQTMATWGPPDAETLELTKILRAKTLPPDGQILPSAKKPSPKIPFKFKTPGVPMSGTFGRPFRKKGKVPQQRTTLMTACGVVVIVFALSVGVLWCLTKIGPIAAQVDLSIKKLGGNLWIAATGLFGCFFAIALLGFGAIYIFSGRR